ncbi:hypothetical protein DFH08DRAFT_1089377 [Mycena albidolilacea]|uniref:Uncharacterized protein n=1 Tax=Mycena albidolilacea TaxID=1033008 RepID=A0AAD6Z1T1_9AGAR|nr:hypothetical protein DFH08DRAFT_1089377 [Mycena albidolilacea]
MNSSWHFAPSPAFAHIRPVYNLFKILSSRSFPHVRRHLLVPLPFPSSPWICVSSGWVEHRRASPSRAKRIERASRTPYLRGSHRPKPVDVRTQSMREGRVARTSGSVVEPLRVQHSTESARPSLCGISFPGPREREAGRGYHGWPSAVEVAAWLFKEIEKFFKELKKKNLLERFARQDRNKSQVEEYGNYWTRQCRISAYINLELGLHRLYLESAAGDRERHAAVLDVSGISKSERLQLLTQIRGKVLFAHVLVGQSFLHWAARSWISGVCVGTCVG